ncbi:MAG: glycosyltransferase family 2 protein [Magnetospirillum sp. WYHS-4]
MLSDVTVVMPAFKAEATLGRALASIAAQTRRPREVIVVVDGTADPSAAAAEAARPVLGDIALTVVRQEKKGPGAARNRGLAEASAPWIAFLDADDEWLPEKLERTLAAIEGEGLTLAATSFLRQDGSETPVDCTRRFRTDDPWDALYRHGYLATSTVVARRDALLAAGGFDETLPTAQDFDLWLKVLAQPGARFVVLPEALTRYHVMPGSITSNIERRLGCTLRVAERHRRRLASHWFRILAVHKEAFDAYRRRGAPLSALRIALTLPWALLVPVAGPLLWAWVFGVAGAYLYQFRDLAGPIARLLGVA